MSDPLNVFVVAGETSGDRIGAGILADLKRSGPVTAAGVGGPALAAEGLQSLFGMDELSVMGLTDVLLRLPRLLSRLRQTIDAVCEWQPDVLVLIDSQEFSWRVAKAVRQRMPDLPIVLCVAPSVWAWRPERAPAMKGIYSHVLAVLPFEPQVMARLGGPPTSYIGHPALDRSIADVDRIPDRVLLLPGSRTGEVRRHLGHMLTATAAIRTARPGASFSVGTLPHLADTVSRACRAFSVDAEIAVGGDAVARAMAEAEVALCVMGTATLELALSGTPTVGVYLADFWQKRKYFQYRPDHLSLPNIILGEPAIPEVLAETPQPARWAAVVADLLANESARRDQRRAFERLNNLMMQGTPEAPLISGARIIRDLAAGDRPA
ncbi:lipid-A-disaccharide synthase [Cucumibacter marinus]|uniref:lipid-A-disaccharide synthase n=1 Tax=Cucumibacter marinus TaxID=1121252 RepID=UPI0003F7DBBC|nr:hypothetical protein [Cucumibacter marinus]